MTLVVVAQAQAGVEVSIDTTHLHRVARKRAQVSSKIDGDKGVIVTAIVNGDQTQEALITSALFEAAQKARERGYSRLAIIDQQGGSTLMNHVRILEKVRLTARFVKEREVATGRGSVAPIYFDVDQIVARMAEMAARLYPRD